MVFINEVFINEVVEKAIEGTNITIEKGKYIIYYKRSDGSDYNSKTKLNSQVGRMMTVFLENLGSELTARNIIDTLKSRVNGNFVIDQDNVSKLIHKAFNRFDLTNLN